MTLLDRSLRRGAGATLAAAALLLSPLAPAPAVAADVDGRGLVTVKVLDSRGRPALTRVVAMRTDGYSSVVGPGDDDNPEPITSWTGEVLVGEYGFATISPWGGLTCFGVGPCSLPVIVGQTPPSRIDPVLTVTDDSDTPVAATLRLAVPGRVTGRPAAGRRLRVALSPGLLAMKAALPQDHRFGIQWLRDGKVIRRATSAVYRVKRRDRGHRLTARLAYPAKGRAIFAEIGITTAPYSLVGKRVRRR